MKINEITEVEKYEVTLELNVDFMPTDIVDGINSGDMVISEKKLNEIAIQHGFDECYSCKKISNYFQQFVNATFIKKIYRKE